MLILLPVQVSSQWGLSRSFLGFIVLPIAGNACEHITGECPDVGRMGHAALGLTSAVRLLIHCMTFCVV